MLKLYLAVAIGFFIYSFTHVDLNLTLSSNKLALDVVSSLQRIAYYDRPLSTNIYLVLSAFAIVLFLLVITKLSKKLTKFPWKWVIAISLLFAFAYPFLSHDIFNYIFYARTIIKYKQSPHVAPPNWFPQDDWIRFMRWVHVPSPYGPLQTLIALPAYILGLGKLTLSLFWMKAINYAFYILSIKAVGDIGKTLKKTKNQILTSQLFLALNPLILIEGLANAHNDAIMMSIYLISLSFLLRGKQKQSLLYLAFSAGVKYITIVTAPLYLLSKKLSKSTLVNIQSVILSILVILFYIFYGFQIWYGLWAIYAIVPSKSKIMKNAAILFSIGGMLYYSSHIYTGLWNQEPWFIKTLIFTVPAIYALGHYTLLNVVSARRKK